jgi:hypothetical protein
LNVRFDDLAKVCADHFGEPRQDGTSHKVYKTPWQGDPRVSIQRAARTAIPSRTKCGRCSMQFEDGEHVATVAEFPSLSWLAHSG